MNDYHQIEISKVINNPSKIDEDFQEQTVRDLHFHYFQ